jgi:hypothetical protein
VHSKFDADRDQCESFSEMLPAPRRAACAAKCSFGQPQAFCPQHPTNQSQRCQVRGGLSANKRGASPARLQGHFAAPEAGAVVEEHASQPHEQPSRGDVLPSRWANPHHAELRRSSHTVTRTE